MSWRSGALMPAFSQNVYDKDFIQCLNLYEDETTGELIATLIEDADHIRLSPQNVRDLRVALQAYERKLKREGRT